MERGWTVVCEDESIFTYDSVLRCIWAKRGSEPFVLTTGSHRHSCVFGAMSIDGRQLFRQRSSIDGENFLAYLKELKRKFAPMLLFLDRSRAHYRDQEVRKFLMENSDSIEVIWFPRARPDLNPVEECWRQSKDIVLANRVYPSFDEMKRRISRILRTRRFKLNIVEYLC
jgi:transposase